ncbi:MAG: MFS transporter [Candidatus Solibacter usitatus]|nr:MFS transporter [Candidatus Solibacter usitatus]
MNPGRLFLASCLALITTSMVFSIRGDILDALGADFHLNKEQLGMVLSPAFWGFTVSIIIGGSLVDLFGMRRLLAISGWAYVVGVVGILFAPRPSGAVSSLFSDTGTLILYACMLILGLAQGLVEGVINPLCATLFPNDKTHRMNILHAWWPGGLIIGGLLAFALTKILGLDAPGLSPSQITFGWQVKLATVMVPAAIYLFMIRGQHFPATERVAAGISNSQMLREAYRPMFLLLWVCMWMTAASELGPDQWVSSLITQLTGMQGVLILVYTAGLMFVLRFFGGPLAHRFSPFGLMTLSALFAAAGLFLLGGVKSPAEAFVAATIFGIGKTYFWPTMLGITSELFPRGGALLLAIMGGTGNLAVAFVLPMMGGWYDTAGPAAAFRYVGVLPVILTVIFGGLFVYYRSQGGYRAEKISVAADLA